MSEDWVGTQPGFWSALIWKGGTAGSSWAPLRLPAMRCAKVARNRDDWCILLKGKRLNENPR
jgi:hypothetical protein